MTDMQGITTRSSSGSSSILTTVDGMRHIAIAGNMGVGKSTLTAALSERLQARAYYETVEDHPYLERYYSDMPRWAFQSQFFFMAQAFAQHSEILHSPETCVQDRTIYEHFDVFAKSLHDQGILGDDDFGVLANHFASLTAVVPGPDLMIYLRASVPTLQARIARRDRSIETTVGADYLEQLEARYEGWMATYEASDVMIVDTDSIDIHDDEQREALLKAIEQHLSGKVAGQLAVA